MRKIEQTHLQKGWLDSVGLIRGMCNCGKRAAAAAATRQADATPITAQGRRGIRAAPEPVIHDPVVWGPHMWTAFHTLSLAVPFGAARAEWLELLTPLAASLPCPECAGHYTTWLASHPLVSVRRRTGGAILMMQRATPAVADIDIAAWLLDLHNAVNGRKGVAGWDLDAVRVTYTGGRDAVRTAIEAVRGMVGARAIRALEVLLGRL